MAKGLDVSEKHDLWVPAVLLVAGVALLVWNILGDAGSVGVGILAFLVAFAGAIACLPIRLRRGQARMVGFGAGVALVLAATIPGLAPTFADRLAWVIAGLAFIVPLERLSHPVRVGFLAAGAVLAILGVLAFVHVLPSEPTWLLLAGAFHLAAQVFSSRPRPEPAIPPGPRVCVMGGSFDPFHKGHRALAEAALRVVDRLLVVPAGQAPHKQGDAPPVDFHHRVAMARLGVEGLPRTEVLELEGRRQGPSYTVETLDVLRTSYPEGTRFLLLVGADMYQDFPNWRDWERILASTTLLVAGRPGYDMDPPPEFEGRSVAEESLQAALLDVSSTRIREAFAAGEKVTDEELSPSVRAYIRDHELYV